jgi:hypothetical protein
MKFTDQDLDEFIEAYEADFGDTISRAEALEYGQHLISVFLLLAQVPGKGVASEVPSTPPASLPSAPDP